MGSSSPTDPAVRDRTAALAWWAASLHLALCLVAMAGVNLGWIPLSRSGALLVVNVNMLLAASAFVAAARARRTGRYGADLLGTACLLLAAESAAMIVELTAKSQAMDWLSLVFTAASRGALLLLASLILTGRVKTAMRSRRLLLTGAALFLVTDLLFFLVEPGDGAGIWPGEIGFYAGYWLMAQGAISPKQP